MRTAVIFFTLTMSFGASLALNFANPARALASSTCGLTQGDFDTLTSIQNDWSLDYAEKARTELKLRKKILGDTLRCAINEATSLKNSVDKIELDNQDADNLRSQFSNQLDNVIKYYEIQQSKREDLGLRGSKDFAKNLESWRDGNYKPVAKKAVNFLIWAKNQTLMETAQNRIDQISRGVILLRLTYNENIQNLWRSVESRFSEARSLNDKARNDLATASSEGALTTIKLSLDALSQTYEKLAELIAAINKALALPG